MPSIYKYTNYRDFLRDAFIEQKQLARPLTHRAVLKQMGITSTGFLSNVISCRKNLSDGQSASLSRILGLARREQRYFNCMVAFTQAKSLEEKKKRLDKLTAMRNCEIGALQGPQLDLFTHWYYVYIRDLFCFIDWNGDYEALAAMLDPPVKPHEAEQAVRDLQAMGLLQKDGQGRLRPTENIVSTGDEVHSVQLAGFQLATMDMAKRAFEKHPPQERDISFVSLTLSPDGFARVKEDIQSFRKKLLLTANEDQLPDRVYQCNIQLFPVTKKQGGAV